MSTKEKRRITPIAVTSNATMQEAQKSELFNDFMRSLDDPEAAGYFERRAAELGYRDLKVKNRKPVIAKVVSAEPVPAMVVKDGFDEKLEAFVVHYAKLKKKEKASLWDYLEKNYRDHKQFNKVTQRFQKK